MVEDPGGQVVAHARDEDVPGPGIARAVARPPLGWTMGSVSPWTTSVGTVIRRTCAVRSPDAWMAPTWRATSAPLRGPPRRSQTARAQVRSSCSSGGWTADPMCASRDRCRSTDSSAVRAAGLAIRIRVEVAGWPTLRLPVVEKIEVRVAARSGCRAARVCAIMPPMDMPTRWTRSTPRWSRRPRVSAAMSARS